MSLVFGIEVESEKENWKCRSGWIVLTEMGVKYGS